MSKVNSKYLFEIASELRMDLVRRSPAASYSYIVLSLVFAANGMRAAAFKPAIIILGTTAFFATIWRIYLSRKIVKNKSHQTNKNLKRHNYLILVNATCFSAIFSLICLGNSQTSLPLLMTVIVMCAVLIGGVSSLSPAPRTQLYFFSTCTLFPLFFTVLRLYVYPAESGNIVFPILFTVVFVYVHFQGKQFRKHLIERYEYEFMLKDERDHLQSVLDAVPGFIIYLDKSLKILSITAGLEKKFDNTMGAGDSLDTDKFEFTRMVQQFRKSIQKFMTKEICLPTKSSQEWYLISFKKIDHGQNIVIVGASIDELRGVREDLEGQTKRAMNASKLAALGELAAGAAHEINNPVAIIYGYMVEMKKMLEKEVFTTKEKFEDRVAKAQKTLLRIKKIVSGMQLLSRDAEDDPYMLTPVKTIIEDTLSLCQERFDRQKIKFNLGFLPEANLVCRPTQISQVLLNLINNACDAIQELDERWINIYFESTGLVYRIHVSDNGPGIPGEVQPRIYDPFFTTKDPGMGTGLGLSICKRIVQEHKGTIKYTYNKGAQFTLEFPLPDAMSKVA